MVWHLLAIDMAQSDMTWQLVMWSMGVWSHLRALTVDVGYVPNVKYLAHIPHQPQKIAP